MTAEIHLRNNIPRGKLCSKNKSSNELFIWANNLLLSTELVIVATIMLAFCRSWKWIQIQINNYKSSSGRQIKHSKFNPTEFNQGVDPNWKSSTKHTFLWTWTGISVQTHIHIWCGLLVHERRHVFFLTD